MTSQTPNQAPKQAPLHGIRVIDLTAVVLGPYATQILGDYGADVIKIESPVGDIMRHAGPMKHPGMGHIFMNANRNKRSVMLDLKKPRDHAALLKLCASADVLAYNIRPASMARLGLSFEVLHQLNPRLIVCGAYGFSEGGPYSDWPAYDDLIQGAVGIPWLMEQSGAHEPRYIPTTFADRVTALNMVHAIMAALIARDRKGGSGLGQEVEVPMFECLLQFVMGEHLSGETWQPAIGEMGYARLLANMRKPYKTSDGYICALVYNDAHWRTFLNFVGQSELWLDARFNTLGERLKNIDFVYSFVQTHLAKNTSAHWLAALNQCDIPVMPMMSLHDLLHDPHLKATGAWLEMQHPHEGSIRQFRPPVRMSATPPGIRRHAPTLGEHNVEVLREIGFET